MAIATKWNSVKGVTRNFLVGFQACSTTGNPHLGLKPGQKSATGEVTGSSGEATAVIFAKWT